MGEILVFAAAFRVDPIVGALIVPGALLGAAYMFRVSLKMAWGRPTSPVADDGHHSDAETPNDGSADAGIQAEAAAMKAEEEHIETSHGGDHGHGGHGDHDDERESKWPDLNFREWTYCAIPAFLVLLIGLAPTPFLNMVTPSVDKLLSDYTQRTSRIVVETVDGSEAVKSALFASIAVKLVLEPGRVEAIPAGHLDAVANLEIPAVTEVSVVLVAANQGEMQ